MNKKKYLLKKILICLMLIFIIGFSFTSCGKKNALSFIQKKGVIRIGTFPYFPPFEFKNNNKLEGIDIDIGNKIAKKIGVRAEFIEMPFNNIFSKLNSRKFDIAISAITTTKQRALNIEFSNKYFSESNKLIINKNNIISLNKIGNKEIGVQNGSTQYNVLTKYTKNIQKFSSFLKMAEALANNKLDGVYVSENMAKIIVKKYKKILKISYINLNNFNNMDDYAIILPGVISGQADTMVSSGENQSSLLEIINNTIDEIKENGFLKKSIEKNINKAVLN